MASLGIPKEGRVGKYLGLPEHFGRRKKDLFTLIVDRIHQKAASMSTRQLSAVGGGELTMLKMVLSAMPSHSMMCFKLRKSLTKRIQSAYTRFWWDTSQEKKKMCWVSWETMALPKYAGGLGFRDIQTSNDALLAKISWRILKEPQSLLAQVLLGKYSQHTSFLDCSALANASHGWRSILAGRDLLKNGLSWAVGDGEKISVWNDPWLSSQTPT